MCTNPPTCPPSPAPSDAGGAEGAAHPEGLTWWLQQGAQVFLRQGGDLERTKKKKKYVLMGMVKPRSAGALHATPAPQHQDEPGLLSQLTSAR